VRDSRTEQQRRKDLAYMISTLKARVVTQYDTPTEEDDE
jgi:hypothetical protein